MDHIFLAAGYHALGKRLIFIARWLPSFLVTKTSAMTTVVKLLFLSYGASRRVRRQARNNNYVGKLLGFKRTQYSAPGITWGNRGGHPFPLVLATYDQQLQYFDERSPVQVAPQLVKQVDHIFRGKKNESPQLPKGKLSYWLQATLENSPTHWYLERSEAAGDRSVSVHMDFSTVVDDIAHESTDCKYNVRDLTLGADGTLTFNAKTSAQSVVRVNAREDDADQRPFQHNVFFALTLVQQANSVSYHNWVHFYFNDLVCFNLENHFRPGHWLRTILDPHMRYQTVLNNAGMFAPTPSQSMPNEVYDDILYGGMLSSWSPETFRNNVVDKCLGYYVKADHAPACRETRRLDFNLNTLVRTPHGDMENLSARLETLIAHFLSDMITRCATEEDLRCMSLVNENVLRFLHPTCLDGIPAEENDVKGVFRRLLTRYMLQAGVLHGIEHFSMYFWSAPLRLPQRIREFYNVERSLDDYSYAIDKQNGYFGNQMFTRYWPNADGAWNWSTLDYRLADAALQTRSQAFIAEIRAAIVDYDKRTLAPARAVLAAAGIEVGPEMTLTPKSVGTSICI